LLLIIKKFPDTYLIWKTFLFLGISILAHLIHIFKQFVAFYIFFIFYL
jgi:hypothetical protein